MKLRKVTKDEFGQYEWIQINEVGVQHPFYIRGVKKTEPPPLPDDGYVYIHLKEITKYDDVEQSWEWVPMLTPED